MPEPAGGPAAGAAPTDAGGDREPVFDRVSEMPGHLLRRCQQIAVSVFLDECRAHDLTPLQFAVLSTLMQWGPLDQVGISGRIALDRTTVSVVVRNLEERGLVRREVSATDRRSKPVSITEAGERLVGQALPAVEAAQERMLSPLTAGERRRFVQFLNKVADGNNAESRAPLKY